MTLKTGEKLEGKITAETDKDVTIDVKVSEGVTDERTILKADTTSVEKTTPDQLAYEAVKGLRIPDDEFSLSALDGQIGALTNFLNLYPGSSHAAEVKENLDLFNQDRSRLEKGQLKVFGKWLSKEAAYKQRYEIEAQQLFNAMQAQVAGRDLIGALNTFTDLEKSYAGARIFPDAIDRARQIIAVLRPQLDHMLDLYRHDEEERIKGLDLAQEPEKSELIAAAKAEAAKYDAICAMAITNRQKWVPLLPRSEKSLTLLQVTAGNEEARLIALNPDIMHQSNEALDKAAIALEEKDAVKADQYVKEAVGLWPANHRTTEFGEQVNKLQIELRATPTPSPSPSAKPSARPSPTATPVAIATPLPPPPDSGIMSMVMSPTGMLLGGGVVVLAAGGAVLATRSKKQKLAAIE